MRGRMGDAAVGRLREYILECLQGEEAAGETPITADELATTCYYGALHLPRSHPARRVQWTARRVGQQLRHLREAGRVVKVPPSRPGAPARWRVQSAASPAGPTSQTASPGDPHSPPR